MYLDFAEYEVLRLSYGLDCDKHSAKQIANELGIAENSVVNLRRQGRFLRTHFSYDEIMSVIAL